MRAARDRVREIRDSSKNAQGDAGFRILAGTTRPA
jgi:hypothetical protein